MPRSAVAVAARPFTERARKASQGAAHPPVSAAAVSGRGREVRASQSATAAGSRQRVEQYQAAARRPWRGPDHGQPRAGRPNGRSPVLPN